MPRVRPRLRLALALLGTGALVTCAALALRWLPTRSPRQASARYAPAPPAVPEDRARRALASAPDLPLDAQHTDVLLALVCTLRRDRLEPYGGPRPTTPFLQLVADHGALFEHAIVQSSWTRPSTGSLLTGRYAHALQLDDPGKASFHNRALADSFVTVAEALDANGYRTIGASGNPNISSTFGFHQGFDVHHEPERLWREAHGPPPSGADLNTQLLEELDKVGPDERVYLQPFFVDTHAPRRPSRKAVRDVNVPETKSSRRVLNYDASLLTLDAHLAQLYLEAKQRRPNLLLVVIGDHGEGLKLPEHHGKGHGNHLYTSTTDVPFMWFHPSLPDPGRRIDGLSMGIDLLPTLLDLLGLEPPEPVDGDSQAAALLGQTDRATHQTAFTETLFRKSQKTAIVGQGYQMIRDHELPQGDTKLYTMDEPLQVTDVAGNHPRVIELLGAELDRWEEAQRQAVQQGGPPVEGEPSSQMVEQLRTLGYIE